MEHSIVLVTGGTSGLGLAAARSLAEDGWREVIITGRSLAKAKESAAQLALETGKQVFTPLELDLDTPTSVQSAVAFLAQRGGQKIDFLLLNAGLVSGNQRIITPAGVESTQAPLIGHHQLVVGLLNAKMMSDHARIIIAGAEPARGDVPLFNLSDISTLATEHHKGDRIAAVESALRNGSPPAKYNANQSYADAKLFIAFWTASLARRLPPGMAVYAVSPGSAPDTNAGRNCWTKRSGNLEILVHPNRETHTRYDSDP